MCCLNYESPIPTYTGTEAGKWCTPYTPTLLEIEYFRSFPDFIEVVKRLPAQYEFSEHVNALIASCHVMGLLNESLDWKKTGVLILKKPIRALHGNLAPTYSIRW